MTETKPTASIEKDVTPAPATVAVTQVSEGTPALPEGRPEGTSEGIGAEPKAKAQVVEHGPAFGLDDL
ncbi:hypothetical protein BB934_45770 (plasmid) [Microvirga ossetica]|uniref:Uncharacterized protein n=1 Tax=Microvirga ossetica TaxID=1882682 RepID=A0A1B2EZV7_9HYPH|nr:hypothetical protein [Microvirga ossetica]ANY85530.1 hypothetical protein BB934_45770 [Microvirga ossetica]